MKLSKLFLVVIIASLLSSCADQESLEASLKKMAPEKAYAEAQVYADLLANKDMEGLKALLPPDVVTEEFQRDLEGLFRLLPPSSMIEGKIAGYYRTWKSINLTTTSIKHRFNYQYQYADGWAIVTVTLTESENELSLSNVNINQLQGDLRVINKFNLMESPIDQFPVLVLLILIPMFVLYTLITAIKNRKTLRWKYLWYLLILIGYGTYTLDWTTGGSVFEFSGMLLLSAGFTTLGPFSPLIIRVAFPFGALLFWVLFKRGKLTKIKNQDQVITESQQAEEERDKERAQRALDNQEAHKADL